MRSASRRSAARRPTPIGLPQIASLSLLLAAPAGAIVIDNGLAPPDPANVYTGGELDVIVRDQGCAGEPTPCPSPGPPTTVSVEAYLLQLTTFDSSTGIVSSDVTEFVDAHDASQIVLAGGLVYALSAYDQASILLAGGSVDASSGPVQLFGSSSLQMETGYLPNVTAEGSSSVLVNGGTVVDYLRARDVATMLVSGGQIGSGGPSLISSSAGAVVTVIGGLVFSGLEVVDGGMIRIVGSDFAIDGQPVGLGPVSVSSGLNLTGTLAGGGSLHADFFSQEGGGTIVLVPEPSTGLLMGAGLLAMGLRRRGPRRRGSAS